MTGVASIAAALVLAFIAYKVLMGIVRVAVIVAIVGVLGYLYSNGTLSGMGA